MDGKEQKIDDETEGYQPYFMDYSSYLSLIGQQDWFEIIQPKEKGRGKDTSIVRDLDLEYCKIDDYNVKSLMGFQWPVLRNLNIRKNRLTSLGIYELAQGLNFGRLSTLVLGYNQIGSSGIKLLTKIDFPQLRDLCLCSSLMCNEGAKHLSKLQSPKLQKLRMRDNNIELDGISQFTTHNGNQLALLSFAREDQRPAIAYLAIVSARSGKEKIAVPVCIGNPKLEEMIGLVLAQRFCWGKEG